MPYMFQVLVDFDGDLFEVMKPTLDELEKVRSEYAEKGAVTSEPVEVSEEYVPFSGLKWD